MRRSYSSLSLSQQPDVEDERLSPYIIGRLWPRGGRCSHPAMTASRWTSPFPNRGISIGSVLFEREIQVYEVARGAGAIFYERPRERKSKGSSSSHDFPLRRASPLFPFARFKGIATPPRSTENATRHVSRACVSSLSFPRYSTGDDRSRCPACDSTPCSFLAVNDLVFFCSRVYVRVSLFFFVVFYLLHLQYYVQLFGTEIVS